ncbi:MAG: hypothetical protein QOE31_3441 [Solirubrobacteraceae bacterium]|nr:hypothetical protein [Solirubrobacteraceae bacterium]
MSRRGAAPALALAALALAAGGTGQAAAAPGQLDTSFAGGGTAATPFGLGARAFGMALAPDGRIVVAGDQRGAGGEGALSARFSAAGVLDRSFAGSGGRIDRFGSGATPQRAGAVAVQADGSAIVAGVAGGTWSLARYQPDGLSDGLFGAAGVTLRDPTPGAGPEEEYPGEEPSLPDGTGPAAIALAANGQIVVAGNTGVENDDGVPGEQIVVARFGPTGVPDPAFGRDGFVLLQLGFGSAVRHASSAARALSLLPDGRILLAGRASARDGGDRALVARLTAAGRLDTSFARQGRLLVQLGRASAARVASSALEALVQRPDGRLLAAGRATDVAGGHMTLVASFTAGGALDNAFGRHGFVVTQLGTAAARTAPPASLARALALAPDGSAVVAGAATGGSAAARFGPLGNLDCGFGSRGRASSFGSAGFDAMVDGAYTAALQPDGNVVVAGRRAGGGLLLGRLLGGASSAPAPAAAPRLVTLAPRYTGRGRGYAYGVVDSRCSPVDVRFTIAGPNGRTVKTPVQRVRRRYGSQVVCATLTGLRPGRRYAIRVVSAAGARAHGAQRTLRALAPGRRGRAQEGCT